MGDPAPDHLLSCNLKLEDEFVLTRIRSKAKSLTTSTARDQFFGLLFIGLFAESERTKQ